MKHEKQELELGDKAILLIEEALNIELPDSATIQLTITEDPSDEKSELNEIRATLSRSKGITEEFNVRQVLGSMLAKHRT